MKPEFTPEWIETLKERYSDVEGNTKVISRLFEALDEISRLQSRVQELEDELMFYQMECPDLVGRYQPPKDGE